MPAVAKKTIGFYSFWAASARHLLLVMSNPTQKSNLSAGRCFSYPGFST